MIRPRHPARPPSFLTQFSDVSLAAHHLLAGPNIAARQAAWYTKPLEILAQRLARPARLPAQCRFLHLADYRSYGGNPPPLVGASDDYAPLSSLNGQSRDKHLNKRKAR